MIYQEHAHRKLRQAFDAILQQFSSNGNRESMLSANRSFQAQNSTCSTLLQTMLLYETCIVLSRKCLWDVNKDFWYQWRSLVITTLSARAIYRQIPVSYLQTWYKSAKALYGLKKSPRDWYECFRMNDKYGRKLAFKKNNIELYKHTLVTGEYDYRLCDNTGKF